MAKSMSEESIMDMLEEAIQKHKLIPSDETRKGVASACMLFSVKTIARERGYDKMTKDVEIMQQADILFLFHVDVFMASHNSSSPIINRMNNMKPINNFVVSLMLIHFIARYLRYFFLHLMKLRNEMLSFLVAVIVFM